MLSVEVLLRSEFFERDTLHREIIFHGALAEKCLWSKLKIEAFENIVFEIEV